jgi:hypothetical protein
LVNLGPKFIPQFAYDKGQGYRENYTTDNNNRIISQGVSDDDPYIPIGKKKFEISQPRPGTGKDTFNKSAGDTVVLKGNDHPKHGEIAKNNIPQCRGQCQDRKFGVCSGPSFFPDGI